MFSVVLPFVALLLLLLLYCGEALLLPVFIGEGVLHMGNSPAPHPTHTVPASYIG